MVVSMPYGDIEVDFCGWLVAVTNLVRLFILDGELCKTLRYKSTNDVTDF